MTKSTITVGCTINPNGDWIYNYEVLGDPIVGLNRIVNIHVTQLQYDQIHRVKQLHPMKMLYADHEDLRMKMALVRDKKQAVVLSATDILDKFDYEGGTEVKIGENVFDISCTTIEILSKFETPEGYGTVAATTVAAPTVIEPVYEPSIIHQSNLSRNTGDFRKKRTTEWVTMRRRDNHGKYKSTH